MAVNEILPFGAGASNELTQAAYAADAQRTSGNQPGIARSPLVNKALHQSSTIAAGVAQFIADRQGANVTDTLLPSQVAALLVAALGSGSTLGNPGNIALPGGWILKVGTTPYADLAVEAAVVVNYGTPFPNAAVALMHSVQSSQLVTSRTAGFNAGGFNVTLHEFDTTAVGGALHWFALGY